MNYSNPITLTARIVTVLVFTLVFQAIHADVRLNRLFSSGMVVQRDTDIPIWGWAEAGETVSISTSWGATAQTVAAKDGSWKATIETPEAGGPFEITVSGNNKIVIDDVLSGEVWFCGGQSNMDFAMSRYLGDAREPQYQPIVEYVRNEVATAVDNQIRHIEVPQTTSLFEKKTDFEGQWVSVKPGQTELISGTGYFFARELRQKLNVPIGLVECSWGGTRIQPWISEETYRADETKSAYFESENAKNLTLVTQMDAADYVDSAYESNLKLWEKSGRKGSKPNSTIDPRKDRQAPATLYNGMLASVIPYRIKGVLWYQGESNARYMNREYESYLNALVESWRADWGQGDFPFYWVQLAGYDTDEDRGPRWAMVNDHLRRGLKLPNTGMAVAHDIGEGKDIHPHNKIDVGKRLSLWALSKDYGIPVAAVSGPLFKKRKVKGSEIVVTFDEVGSGLMVASKVLLKDPVPVEEPLMGFEIVGDDGVWKDANAKISAKNKVVLSHPNIAKPTHARYAWKSNPENANLYNREGLPAAVFTTE